MPVFISHKDKDSREAVRIHDFLKRHNISSYVDVLDSSTQSTADITDTITDRMNKCTHLIAVMSNETVKSWWVPFEVGEATFGMRRISSYDLGCGYRFPEYLQKWPVMSKQSHLSLFVRAYKSDSTSITKLHENRNTAFGRKTYGPDDFHKSLARSLRFSQF